MPSFSPLSHEMVVKEMAEAARRDAIAAAAAAYHFDDDGDPIDNDLRESFYSRLLANNPVVRIFRDTPFLPASDIPRSLPGDTPCCPTRPRNVVWTFLNDIESGMGMLVFIVITCTIVLSIVTFCAQSMPLYRGRAARGVYGTPESSFDIVEASCVAIFSLDYVLRLLTCTTVSSLQEEAYIARFGWTSVKGKPVPLTYAWTVAGWAKWLAVTARKTVGFVLKPLNLVDLAAILPFYVTIQNFSSPGANGGQIAIIRVLRLARILRLLRLAKGMEGVRILGNTIVAAVDALGFLSFFVLLACVLMGSLVFFAEEGTYDPDTGLWMRPDLRGQFLEPSPFASIPHSFWYTIVTMTTVGYGDFYPTTAAGRVAGTFTMIIGILVLALPITVVGQAFTVEIARMRAHNREQAARERAARASIVKRELLRRVSTLLGPPASDGGLTEGGEGGGGDAKPTAIPVTAPPSRQPSGRPPIAVRRVAPDPSPSKASSSTALGPAPAPLSGSAESYEQGNISALVYGRGAGGGLSTDDGEAIQDSSETARDAALAAERGVRDLQVEVRELLDLVTRVLALQGVVPTPRAMPDDAPGSPVVGRMGLGISSRPLTVPRQLSSSRRLRGEG